jgi:hypothetical protein
MGAMYSYDKNDSGTVDAHVQLWPEIYVPKMGWTQLP